MFCFVIFHHGQQMELNRSTELDQESEHSPASEQDRPCYLLRDRNGLRPEYFTPLQNRFCIFPLTCISLFSTPPPPPPQLLSHPLLLKLIRGRQTVSRAAVPKGASVFFKNLVFIDHDCLVGPGGPERHWQKRGCQGRPAKMPAPWTVQSRGGQTDGYLNRPSSCVVFGPLGTSPWTSTSNYVFIWTNTHWSVLLSITPVQTMKTMSRKPWKTKKLKLTEWERRD